MNPAHLKAENISLDGASGLGTNYTDYHEPAKAATLEGALLRFANDRWESPGLSNSERTSLRELAMGLSGLRQYNLLVACDGPRAGRHGCLYVAGQALFGEAGAPRATPCHFQNFQHTLITAHQDASRGEKNPKPVSLESAVDAGLSLVRGLAGTQPTNAWGN
jgi:hypothetical protein